jgi:hypothetical protein
MKNLLLAFSCILLLQAAGISQSVSDATGKAIVYVYSYPTTTTIGQIRKPVYLDEIEIADIRPERFFIVLVEPGKHTFHLKNKKFGGIERDFQANQTYYMRIDWRNNGFAVVPQGLLNVPVENGAYDVKQLRPIDNGNVKDKTRVILKLSQ